MSEKELYKILSETNLPVSFYNFIENQEPPFIYVEDGEGESLRADNYNYYNENHYSIYLITEKIDTELDKKVCGILDKYKIPYDYYRDKNYKEKIFQTIYEI